MYELSDLKAKKLSELQEIAKKIGLSKIGNLKKIDLTYKIIDFQSTQPDASDLKNKIKNSKSSPNKSIEKNINSDLSSLFI